MVAASLDVPLEDVQILWYYRNAEKIVYELTLLFFITDITFSCFYGFELIVRNLILLDFR